MRYEIFLENISYLVVPISISYPQPLWNVEGIPVEYSEENSPPQRLWITVDNPTPPCGKKVLAALRKIAVFHISFLYGYEYYLNYLLIYISLYI